MNTKLVWAAAAVSLALACHRAHGGAPSWKVSADQKTWAPVLLPSVAWGCDDCDRWFRTTVHGRPRAVTFRFASDNKARLLVNGAVVFDTFWKDNTCSEKACCDDCCDSTEHCKAVLAKAARHELSAAALARFHDGDNDVVWQVHQEIGGSGFDVELRVDP
jgi:hypothetical protein